MNTTSSDTGIQLFVKKGRRYVPWGNANSWYDHDHDLMEAGSFRLVHCINTGHHRTYMAIEPDYAAFLAAASVARVAMEKAMEEAAKGKPCSQNEPYTEEQQKLIQDFRDAMAKTGALVPTFWNNGSASEIASAGVMAVKKAMEESQ